MNRIVSWARLPGLAALCAAALFAGCEAPTSPVAVAPLADDPAVLASKKADVQPSLTPLCTERWDATRALCRAEVNVRHGNNQGLPVNLNGVRNSNQLTGNGNGANLMVTVLGTPQFNLAAVDLNTIRAGDVNTNPPRTPVNLLPNGRRQASIVDVNGDGILDLVLHFSIPEMVTNGDLSEATRALCLYGEGPGYVLNGCGMGGGNGGGNGGNEPPPPHYSTLPACGPDVALRPSPGHRCAVIQLFGRDGNVAAPVLQINGWLTDPNDGVFGYPDWATKAESTLLGTGTGHGRLWQVASLPLGTDNSNSPYYGGDGSPGTFLQRCGLAPSGFVWGNFEQVLVRKDLYVPPEARNVQIEFVVDDRARIFWNGGELTNGWVTGAADAVGCRSYSRSTRLSVPLRDISLGGTNRLGVWASDAGGFVNYLDVRVYAEVPIS